MQVPVGGRFTANLSESRPKSVTCEKCQTEFVYFMKRSASGSGSSLLFLDNQGAKLRAHDEANAKLYKRLNEEQDPVPCPTCGWVQLAMIPHARQQYHAWMMVLGVVALGVGLAFVLLDFLIGEWWFLNPSNQSFPWVIAAFPIGVSLIVIREILARRYDPNALDIATRRQIGAKRTIPKQKFDDLVLAAQPKAEKHWPIVGATRVVRKHEVGSYLANLEDNIESNRGIIYKYLMRVYSVPGNELQLCITAERNEFALPGVSAPDAYFLRLYTGHEQSNLGSSPDWADIAKFENRALEVVREQLDKLDTVSTDQGTGQ